MSTATLIRQNNCLPYPKIVQFEITDRCPFHCPQCYRLSLSEKDADISFLKKTIIEAKDSGTNLIVLNGGEPLLYKHIVELLSFINNIEIHANCFSSGFGLTEDIMSLLNSPYIHYCISLNGSTREVNSFSREGYEYAIDAMYKLKLRGIPFGIHWVARHDNIKDFPDLISLLEEKEAMFISIGSNKLTHDRIIDAPLTRDDFSTLAEIIRRYQGKLKLLIENCFPELSWELGLNLKNIFSGCGAGRTMCHVTIDANFAPCTHLHYYEKYPSMNEYWTNSDILLKLRHRNLSKFESCTQCALVNSCKMCLATSTESYNDPNKGNSSCFINKKGGVQGENKI